MKATITALDAVKATITALDAVKATITAQAAARYGDLVELLFTSLPSHGHTYPLIPLALAAQAQGHTVTYATGADFREPLAALGFEVIPAGITIRDAFAEAGHTDSDPRGSRPPAARAFTDILPRRFAADLAPVFAERDFDLVVYESGNMGAGLAARVAGLPALSHGYGRATLDRMPGGHEYLSAFAAELGVDATIAGHFGLDHPYLDIYPESLHDKEFLAEFETTGRERIPLRPTPFTEPGELPDWVSAHESPLIYLTLGTAFGTVPVLRTAIKGLAGTGHRVLVAAGPTIDVDVLGEVPDTVTVLPWVPQADLLPHTDLVAHHGGSGTTLGAVAAGVPQLLLPQGADQFLNAGAVADSGAGKQLIDADADAITETARILLSDGTIAAAARALAQEIAAMPSPQELAVRLPEWATR